MALTKELVSAVPSVLNGNVVQWELTRKYTDTVNGQPFEREFSDIIEQKAPDDSDVFPLKPALSFTKTELDGLISDHLDVVFAAHKDNAENPPAVPVPDVSFDLSALPI